MSDKKNERDKEDNLHRRTAFTRSNVVEADRSMRDAARHRQLETVFIGHCLKKKEKN